MRKKENICNDWLFIKKSRQTPPQKEEGAPVTLPHTWNAQDGTDGGNDYYRGRCWYVKRFEAPALAEGKQLWVEFEGAAMSAEVFCNGARVASHTGG